ncbi:MAG TPA: ATPase, T2SS/T4P/T4SS family [Candidatus Saccharimonadales bacterium]|nr:ATPase, T2SS/T4P/T4SS family [Candidatus Saccharimonadales bacterium]
MYDSKSLYDALKELQVISDKQLEEAFVASENQQIPLGNILLDRNLIAEEDLGKLLADIYKMPFIHLSSVVIPKEVLTLIPENMAREQRVIAFKQDENGLHIALTDPTNTAIVDFLHNQLGLPIIVYQTTKQDINNALKLYLKDISQAFADVITASIQEAQTKKNQPVDPPIIKIVETILTYAYQNNASDVHLEPETEIALVRFRIDGVLHDIIQVPIALYIQITTRIKVMAKLRTDVQQVPQDGKIEFRIDNEPLDIRVSIVPIRRGEKIVMRLLAGNSKQITLANLGFSLADLEKVHNAYQKPYGMILSTGPTGSGKTTTMYAVLTLLNNRDVNIMTIEDPIEYDIEGVNQIQVNPQTDLTFASGLRSILRQDPNVILVGEIRDEETAGIATNAAMTGHLVLSTLHTNDAATAVPRLLDMGIEPFLVSSTVNAIIGQRLVRKIHSVCRVSDDVSLKSIPKSIDTLLIEKIFGTQDIVRLYKGKGCELCHNSGYEGRIGIYEVIEMNEEIQQAVVEKKDAGEIKKLAVKNGMTTMLEDGLNKVKAGETTIEELLRVTKE